MNADLGIAQYPSSLRVLNLALLKKWSLPAIAKEGDKNERGHVLIIAGSRETPGAALLASQCALRAGAGKITIATSATIATPLALAVPEARVIALNEGASGALSINQRFVDILQTTSFDAALIGPGMEDEGATTQIILTALPALCDAKIILDATAINSVKKLGTEQLSLLITPHAGEMAHLCAVSKQAVLDNPSALVVTAARRLRCVVALKGSTTLISTAEGEVFEHEGGHCGLAVSGSGDCLAGIIAGLAARGATLTQAAAWGVFVHGRIGESLAQRYNGVGYLASEITAEIPLQTNVAY